MSCADDPKPVTTTKKGRKGKKGKKGRKKRKGGEKSSEEETHVARPQVNVSHGELPDGAMASDSGKEEEELLDDVSKALNQNLDM